MGGSPHFPKTARPQDAERAAEIEREKERERLRTAKGRRSTILTGGLGDQSEPNLGRAVLTGQ